MVRGMTWEIDLRNIIITLTTSTLTNELVNHAAHKIRFPSHVSYATLGNSVIIYKALILY